MKSRIILFAALLFSLNAGAQCPGCVITDCSSWLPGGGICDTIMPDGMVGEAYDEDASAYLPQVFDFPPFTGVRLDRLEIVSFSNLPPGLSWESDRSGNGNVYFPQNGENNACVKICGTPLVAGTFNVTLFLLADVTVSGFSIQNQSQTYETVIKILPPVGGASSFTFEPATGCGSTDITFETNFPSAGNPDFHYEWNFGNGVVVTSEQPATQTFDPGTYEVIVTTTIDTFPYILENITITSTSPDCNDCIFSGACTGLPQEMPDLVIEILQNGSIIYTSSELTDIALPASIAGLGIELDPNSTYSVDVDDFDSFNSDENCADGSFPGNSIGTFTINDVNGSMDITVSHPIIVIRDTVEVTIHPNADPAVITDLTGQTCEGDTVLLATTPAAFMSWYQDSTLVGNDAQLEVLQPGSFWLQTFDLNGCGSVSETYDVAFTDCTCDLPLAISTTDITSTSAVLSWTPSLLAQSYILQGTVAGGPIDAIEFVIGDPTTDHFTANDLTPNRSYEWRIASVCSEDGFVKSDWSMINGFTTLAPCLAPDFTSTNNIGSNSAVLTWLPRPNAVGYEIQGTRAGLDIENGISLMVNNGAQGTFQANGLDGATSYIWRIRSLCGANGIESSDWSGIAIFSTQCAYPEDLRATNITSRSAVIQWTPALGSAGYQLRGRVNGGSWVVINLQGGGTGSLNTGNALPAGAEVDVEVRNECTAGGYSSWSPTFTFMTASSKMENDLTAEQLLRVYPNPANTFIEVDLPNGDFELLRILDLTGKVLFIESIPNLFSNRIDLSDFATGLYTLEISGNEKQQSVRFVVNH